MMILNLSSLIGTETEAFKKIMTGVPEMCTPVCRINVFEEGGIV